MERLRPLLPWLLILLPLWIYLAWTPSFGILQNSDYYITFPLPWNDDGSLTADPIRWLKIRSNEHLSTVPVALWALNAHLFDGTNRTLTLLMLAWLAVTFALLYRRLPPAVTGPPGRRVVAGLVLATFVFTPVAVHNVAMAFSGSQWLSANMLTVIAVTATVLAAERRRMAWLWAVAGCGVVGVLTYSTAVALWPAVLVAAAWAGLRWRGYLWLGLAALPAVAFYVVRYARPGDGGLPEPNTDQPASLAHYLLVYLGGLFTRDVATAAVLGAGGLLAAAVLFPLAWRRAERAVFAPWAAIVVYALASGLGTAVGRSRLGIAQALASRYATLPGLFWSGVAMTAFILLWRRPAAGDPATAPWRRRLAAVLAVVTLALAAASVLRGWPLLDAFARRAERQRLATLALQRGIEDDEILHSVVSPRPDQVWDAVPLLRTLGHVPFDRPAATAAQPEQIERRRLEGGERRSVKGGLDVVVDLEDEAMLRVGGWVESWAAPVRRVLMLDAAGRVHGEMLMDLETGSTVYRRNRGYATEETIGWEGYLPRRVAARVTPWALLADGTLVPLYLQPPAADRLAELSRPAGDPPTAAPPPPQPAAPPPGPRPTPPQPAPSAAPRR